MDEDEPSLLGSAKLSYDRQPSAEDEVSEAKDFSMIPYKSGEPSCLFLKRCARLSILGRRTTCRLITDYTYKRAWMDRQTAPSTIMEARRRGFTGSLFHTIRPVRPGIRPSHSPKASRGWPLKARPLLQRLQRLQARWGGKLCSTSKPRSVEPSHARGRRERRVFTPQAVTLPQGVITGHKKSFMICKRNASRRCFTRDILQ